MSSVLTPRKGLPKDTSRSLGIQRLIKDIVDHSNKDYFLLLFKGKAFSISDRARIEFQSVILSIKLVPDKLRYGHLTVSCTIQVVGQIFIS